MDYFEGEYLNLKIALQDALGNGIDEAAWNVGEDFIEAAVRNIKENRSNRGR